MAQVFERDDNGNVVNPPNNPTYEQELTRARDAADDAWVRRVQGEYDSWRSDEIERIENQPDVTNESDATDAGPTPGTERNPNRPSWLRG